MLIMMLWLAAVLIVFVVARNGAERAQSTTSSRHRSFQGAGAPPSRGAGASIGMTAPSRHPGDGAVVRGAGQSIRATERDVVAPGLVPINSAGVEELCRLPGVGRRAAERIVRHRGRIGALGSLKDLEGIEGFDRERVRRLSERVTL
jgi:DNA uptake protein ComE-like DNA-binding protein